MGKNAEAVEATSSALLANPYHARMGNDCCRGRQASSGRKGNRAIPMIRGIGVLAPCPLGMLCCPYQRTVLKMEKTKERCGYRSKKFSWCVKKGKFCNSPFEYDTCPDYVPRSHMRAYNKRRGVVPKKKK